MKVKITDCLGSGWYGYRIYEVGFFNENIFIGDLMFDKSKQVLLDYAKKRGWFVVNKAEILDVQPIEKPLCGGASFEI